MTEKTSGSVFITFVDGTQMQYPDVTNVSLSKDWAFLRFTDSGRVQIPVSLIREVCEEDGVFVKGVRPE